MPRGIKGSGKAAKAPKVKVPKDAKPDVTEVIETPEIAEVADFIVEIEVAESIVETEKVTEKAPAKKKAMATTRKKATPKKKGSTKLAQIDALVDKVFKDGSPAVDIDSASLRKSKPHLPTGSTILDYLIGGRPNKHGISPCPGWPKGMISNVYGHESSGKTTVALTAAAEVCAAGGQVVFIDWEHAISSDYAQALGVPVTDKTKFRLFQPNTLEDGLKILALAIKAGVDLVILDSVGAGVPEKIFGQSIEEIGGLGRLGLVASKWSLYLPKFASMCSKSGTHVMGISQLRSKISTGPGGGGGTQHQGGKAWLFYSAVRMCFRRTKSLKTKGYDAIAHKLVERMTSAIIRAKMDKCKVAGTQQNEQDFYIVFGQGIDDVRSIIDIASNHGIVKKKAASYSWERGNGDTCKGMGIENFRSSVLAAKGGWVELRALAIKAMSSGPKIAAEKGIDLGEEEDLDLDDILGMSSEDNEDE